MSNNKNKKPKLKVSIQKMQNMEIDNLFNDAVNFFLNGDFDFCYTSFYMFNVVIEKDPNYIGKENEKYRYINDGDNAYYYLGLLYRKNLNDLDNAIKFFSKAIDLCLKDYDSLFSRGVCWSDKNEHEKALDDYKMAKNLGGSDIYDVDLAIEEAEKKLIA